MPPRVAVACILAFWLATTGFIFYRDLWPRLFASGPPPVAIELADEARQNVPARWSISRNGQKVGKLTTQMKYLDAEDAFHFAYHYSDLVFNQGDITLEMAEGVSEVHLTRAGNLKAQTMRARVKASVRGDVVAAGTIDIRGTVTNGVLTGRAELKSSWGNIAGDLDPVEVPGGGEPLNPLQPVNRIGFVRGGQHWRVDESNPLQTAVRDLLKKKIAELGLRLPEEKVKESLVAQVRDEPALLRWQGQDVPCWVIEYRRAEPVARTWVRASDGKVLRQEAFEKGESLTFERED
jgi:hypothetical protein